MEKVPQACGIVIFGASGDLTHRKLVGALYDLFLNDLLPKDCFILGVARTRWSDTEFREKLKLSLGAGADPGKAAAFLEKFTFIAGDYSDPALYKNIKENIVKRGAASAGTIFYLATPPEIYETIGVHLADIRDEKSKIVVEKPFGSDLASARRLNSTITKVFPEKRIYRIDHYLGKETVQNILMFRFANAIYEPVWNRKYIDHIQITAAESEGVGHRAGYYESAGAVRDMFQNHLLQLLCMVAMEPPTSFDADAILNEKSKVLEALTPLDTAHAVRGQYDGYLAEPGVSSKSSTETFAAMKVGIDNWRWQGVPIYLRSGKSLAQRVTEIAIHFKHVPTSIFRPLLADQLCSNVLTFRIQPDESVSMRFEAKHPGPKLCVSTVKMDFDYQEAFGIAPPDAYSRLFLDVMLGDQTLFSRADWLTMSWKFLDPLLERWKKSGSAGLIGYAQGSWGPGESDQLLTNDNRVWMNDGFLV